MGFHWSASPETVFTQGYQRYVQALAAGLNAICKARAAEIEAWMKTNAVWTDQTGNARQGLYTEVERMGNAIVIALDHGVSYGRFLELSHQGRFAIIAPALDHWSPILWADVQRLLS